MCLTVMLLKLLVRVLHHIGLYIVQPYYFAVLIARLLMSTCKIKNNNTLSCL